MAFVLRIIACHVLLFCLMPRALHLLYTDLLHFKQEGCYLSHTADSQARLSNWEWNIEVLFPI